MPLGLLGGDLLPESALWKIGSRKRNHTPLTRNQTETEKIFFWGKISLFINKQAEKDLAYGKINKIHAK